MKLVLIAAVSKNGVIGNQGALPWKLPKEMQHFRDTTRGHTVVMGRKTFETLNKPLPNRRNVILSKSLKNAPEGVCVYSSWEDARKTIQSDETVYICGGAEIYKHFLPLADEVLLTIINAEFNGDTRFPNFENGGFNYTGYHELSRVPLDDQIQCSIVTYRKN